MFHVEKSYARDAQALVDVNLHIEKGEMVFLSGPSGAGKSTLMKLVFGAEEPTRGQILVAGRNVGRIASGAWPYLRRNIGVVFQDFKLLANRTVADNVAYALHVVGWPPREVERRVERVLAAVGLEHKAAALPPRLSGGEQQRVAIARALVNDPMIFLADEPTGNLDEDLSREIMDLIDGIHARGTTVVVATHDRGIIERRRRRVVALERGRIVSDVSADMEDRARSKALV